MVFAVVAGCVGASWERVVDADERSLRFLCLFLCGLRVMRLVDRLLLRLFGRCFLRVLDGRSCLARVPSSAANVFNINVAAPAEAGRAAPLCKCTLAMPVDGQRPKDLVVGRVSAAQRADDEGVEGELEAPLFQALRHLRVAGHLALPVVHETFWSTRLEGHCHVEQGGFFAGSSDVQEVGLELAFP